MTIFRELLYENVSYHLTVIIAALVRLLLVIQHKQLQDREGRVRQFV